MLSLTLLVLAFPILANEPPATDCLIEPNRIVDLGTREEGVIEAISVERGDYIEAGQVLAHLDADVERASVELARVTARMTSEIEAKKVTVSFSQRKQDRHGELFKKKVLHQKADQLQSAINAKPAQIQNPVSANVKTSIQTNHL